VTFADLLIGVASNFTLTSRSPLYLRNRYEGVYAQDSWFNYLSPAPPLLATPFVTAATGVNNGQRFPFPFPLHNVSASNPDSSVNRATVRELSDAEHHACAQELY
jgi:hypothetical protein